MAENKEGLYVVTSSFAAYKDIDDIECLVPYQMEHEDLIIITKMIHHEKSEMYNKYTEIKFLFRGMMMSSSFFNERFPLQEVR